MRKSLPITFIGFILILFFAVIKSKYSDLHETQSETNSNWELSPLNSGYEVEAKNENAVDKLSKTIHTHKQVPLNKIHISGCIYDEGGANNDFTKALNLKWVIEISIYEISNNSHNQVSYTSVKVDGKSNCYSASLEFPFDKLRKYYVTVYALLHGDHRENKFTADLNPLRRTLPVIFEIYNQMTQKQVDLFTTDKFASIKVETIPITRSWWNIYICYRIGIFEWSKLCIGQKIPAGVPLKLQLFSESYLPKEIHIDPLLENETRLVKLHLESGAISLKGRLTTCNNSIPEDLDVNISVWVDNIEMPFLGNIGTDGMFVITGLPDGLLGRINIRCKGYKTIVLRNVDTKKELIVTLETEVNKPASKYIVNGTCTGRKGEPLANISVQIPLHGGLTSSFYGQVYTVAITDKNGSFQFESESHILSQVRFVSPFTDYQSAVVNNVNASVPLNIVLE